MINGNFSEAAPYATIYDPQPTAAWVSAFTPTANCPALAYTAGYLNYACRPSFTSEYGETGKRRQHHSCKPPAIDLSADGHDRQFGLDRGLDRHADRLRSSQQLHGQRLHWLGPLCLRPHQQRCQGHLHSERQYADLRQIQHRAVPGTRSAGTGRGGRRHLRRRPAGRWAWPHLRMWALA